MHILNFIIAMILPYIGIFSKLAPPEAVPWYFFADETAFISGEFYAIVFYWAGFLRNYVDATGLTERKYFAIATLVLVYIIFSKIIYVLPYTWVTSMFSFGLGVLSATKGQTIGRFSLWLMIAISIFIVVFSNYILIGMAWFGFTPADYYYYRNLITGWI